VAGDGTSPMDAYQSEYAREEQEIQAALAEDNEQVRGPNGTKQIDTMGIWAVWWRRGRWAGARSRLLHRLAPGVSGDAAGLVDTQCSGASGARGAVCGWI
jgi:hypothetical protein